VRDGLKKQEGGVRGKVRGSRGREDRDNSVGKDLLLKTRSMSERKRS